jgi:chaperone required for assembly of F1-ATPase
MYSRLCGAAKLLQNAGSDDYVSVIRNSMTRPPEISLPDNPIEATRRGARPALRSRFYCRAATGAVAEGFAVQLDDKPVRTPARRLLAAPTLALAEAIAAEWEAQRDVIDPARMPLTRLANAIIDGVAERFEPVAAEIAKYIASDLLFYRAEKPAALVERQRRHWDPILAWGRQTLGAEFKVGQGVVHVAQPEAALVAARAAIPDDSWRLAAVHVLTTLTGSALIALALARGFLSVGDAWQAANVDEDWNMEQWGRDELALERRNSRFAEFEAAAALLSLTPG